jgi:hypothetical protein
MKICCEGYDPQRPVEYYMDKDYFLFPSLEQDKRAKYCELGSGGDKEYSWFQSIGTGFEEDLIAMSALLLFEYGIEHYLTDYESTTVCMNCKEDVENAYPDVIVFRYWNYCPRCGNPLENGYVKVRGERDIGVVRLDDPDSNCVREKQRNDE